MFGRIVRSKLRLLRFLTSSFICEWIVEMKKVTFRDCVFYGVAIACIAAAFFIFFTKPTTAKFVVVILIFFVIAICAAIHRTLFSTDFGNMLAVMLVAIVLAVYSAELVQVLRTKNQTSIAYSSSHDRRTMREVVTSLRKAGDLNAVPIVYPSYITRHPDVVDKQLEVDGKLVLPLSGISNRTTVLCNESGYWATYQSDEFGFNNPKGIWRNPVDIAVIGDSFSHGNCVHPKEGWVAQLRMHYPRTLNLGMGGNGPLYELATIKEYLPEIKPKIVIWEYFEANDSRIPAEAVLPILQRYLVESDFSQGLKSKQLKIDALLDQIVQEQIVDTSNVKPQETSIPSFNFYDFLALRTIRSKLGLGFSGNSTVTAQATFLKALIEANRLVKSWGGQLYFVYLPSYSGLVSTERPWYSSREDIIRIVDQQRIPVVDLYPAFKAQPDPLSFFPYRGPFHYNRSGYQLVAEKVLERLTQDHIQAQQLAHEVMPITVESKLH